MTNFHAFTCRFDPTVQAVFTLPLVPALLPAGSFSRPFQNACLKAHRKRRVNKNYFNEVNFQVALLDSRASAQAQWGNFVYLGFFINKLHLNLRFILFYPPTNKTLQ